MLERAKIVSISGNYADITKDGASILRRIPVVGDASTLVVNQSVFVSYVDNRMVVLTGGTQAAGAMAAGSGGGMVPHAMSYHTDATSWHAGLSGAQLHNPKAHASTHLSGGADPVDHNSLTNYDANRHIDHTAVTLTAGAGLTGGGDISANRTFAVGAGTLITVGENTVGITPGASHQFIGMGTGTEASWQYLSIPADAEFHVDGALSVITNVAGVWIASCVGTITKVYIHCQNTGSSGETIVDINKNGTTIFTTQSNRPKLLAGASSPVAEAIPDVVALAERDVLSVDIDSVAAGASGLSVLVAIEMGEGAGGMSFSIGGVISTSSFTSDGLEESPVVA